MMISNKSWYKWSAHIWIAGTFNRQTQGTVQMISYRIWTKNNHKMQTSTVHAFPLRFLRMFTETDAAVYWDAWLFAMP